MTANDIVIRPTSSLFQARRTYRTTQQIGYVLHTYSYRETSLIVEVFTRSYGRLSLLAKGAKRAYSMLRPVLYAFHPLSLSWSGKGELRTMTQAEWIGGVFPLSSEMLFLGFYINELLMRFLAREDAHSRLFDYYTLTLNRLAACGLSHWPLRAFERMLLIESGYGQAFDKVDSNSLPFNANVMYTFEPECGWRIPKNNDPTIWPKIIGQTLLDIAKDDYRSPRTVLQSRKLTRFLLQFYLGDQELNTPKILIDLRKL